MKERLPTIPAALTALAAALGWACASAQEADAAARGLAATCAGCHGTGGISAGGTATLAGMPKDAIARTLRAYKSGALEGTVMPQLAKGYTDAQIDALAAWFASQKAR